MASVWVDIEVDLDEVSTYDLIEELECRCLKENHKEALTSLIGNDDKIKFDLFLRVKDKFSVLELEELFKENSNFPIPKEQLKLSLQF